jgi:hypothetical protein
LTLTVDIEPSCPYDAFVEARRLSENGYLSSAAQLPQSHPFGAGSLFPNFCACPVKCKAYFSEVVLIFTFLDLEKTIAFSGSLPAQFLKKPVLTIKETRDG